MKKRGLAAALMLGIAILGLAACGDEETTGQKGNDKASEAVAQQETPLHLMALDGIVTLGDYKNLKVDMPTVSQEEVEANARYYFNQICPVQFGIKDRAVEVGDAINLDYSGTLVGETEPFQGGTAQAQALEIGSGQFIPGFEDQLVGVMPGETVDLHLNFPDNYGNDLAGKPVVFVCTVNYIIPAEMTDEMITALGIGGANTVEKFKEYIRGIIESYNASNSDVQDKILDALLAQTQYGEIPGSVLQQRAQQVKDQIEQLAAQYNMTPEDFVMSTYSDSLDSFIQRQADEMARIYLACQAIANKENLVVTDENLEEVLTNYALGTGCEDVDTFLQEYANGATRDEFREQIMFSNVMEYLVDLQDN